MGRIGIRTQPLGPAETGTNGKTLGIRRSSRGGLRVVPATLTPLPVRTAAGRTGGEQQQPTARATPTHGMVPASLGGPVLRRGNVGAGSAPREVAAVRPA